MQYVKHAVLIKMNFKFSLSIYLFVSGSDSYHLDYCVSDSSQ